MNSKNHVAEHFGALNKAEIRGVPFFSERDTHIPIPLKEVPQERAIDFNIFSRGEYLVYHEKADHEASSKPVQEMGSSRQLYIEAEDWDKYLHYIENTMNPILTGDAPFEEKALLLYQACNHVTQDVIRQPDLPQNIIRVEQIVGALIDNYIHAEKSLLNMIHVMAFDYSLHSHSVNVCMFGLALGCELNLSRADLQHLGTGLLLHDVGKQQTPEEILYKVGPLTENEWFVMKQHPSMGQMLLTPSGKVGRRAMHIVKSHHERCSGSGYPDKLIGTEIDPLAKIAAIADVFDALTTRRVYKNANLTFPALKIMMKEMNGVFKPEYLREFIRMLDLAEQQGEVDMVNKTA